MASTPAGVPDRAPATAGPALAQQRRAENFPVALRVLPRRLLEGIAARPSRVFDRRLSLSGWKAGVAAVALSGLSA